MPLAPIQRTPLVVLSAVALAFVAGVLLAGPIYQGVARFAPGVSFVKVFRYTLLAALVVASLIVARPWRDVPPGVWGLWGRNQRWRLWFVGVATGVLFLVAIAALDAAAGHLTFDPKGPHKLVSRLGTVFTLLLVLGPIEEVFFRGWMFDRFRSKFAERTSHLAVAAIYAGVHAFRERDAPKDLVASVSGALDVLEAWGKNLVDWREFGPSFVGLFLLSLVLSTARRRFETLWFSIGLHGAAASWLHVNSSLTERSILRDWTGSKWLYDGVPGWTVLLLVLFVISRRPQAQAPVTVDASPDDPPVTPPRSSATG